MKSLRFVFVLAIFLVFGCSDPGLNSSPALPAALDAMETDNDVTVEVVRVENWGRKDDRNFYYVFRPASDNQTKAFIFYPGGDVDPRAYAPPLRAIAKAGYLCFLVKMPMNLAPFGVDRATDIINSGDYPEIDKWAIGGHSVGGTFSCSYVKSNPDKIDGLAIWASYPSDMFDLSDLDLDVVLIYGTNNPNTNDGNYPYDPDDVSEIDEKAKPYLPADTVYVEIPGGNHTQFGYYDTTPFPVQVEDGVPEISRDDQQEYIIDATLELLEGL